MIPIEQANLADILLEMFDYPDAATPQQRLDMAVRDAGKIIGKMDDLGYQIASK